MPLDVHNNKMWLAVISVTASIVQFDKGIRKLTNFI